MGGRGDGAEGAAQAGERARTDCGQASGDVDRCCVCFFAGGGWRAWRQVHRVRDPGSPVPEEHPSGLCGRRRRGWLAATHQRLHGRQQRTCLGGGSGLGGTPAGLTATIPRPIPGLWQEVCRVTVLLAGTGPVLQYRVLSRDHLCRRVFCAVSGPWGGTCALQRAEHAMESKLLAEKHHGRDMFGWLSAAERFHTLRAHEMDAYDADHHFSLVPQRGKSARNSALGCCSRPNPNLNPKP